MMTTKRLTFLDASVLINAVRGADPARKLRALDVLGDPAREFVASQFLVLEVLPVPTCYKLRTEVAFYERYFTDVMT
jgi:hypothetical protein